MAPEDLSTDNGHRRAIAICERIYHVVTGVIIGAFVLIIAMTTVSTGDLVRSSGKILYYVIALSILVSLASWYCRRRAERRLTSSQTA